MAVKRREVRSIVILSPKGRFYGDSETDELEKAVMTEAASLAPAGPASAIPRAS